MSPERVASSTQLLVDNSVWSRARHSGLSEEWARQLGRGRLVACPPFLIEAGYSARSADDLRRIRRLVKLSMAQVDCDDVTWEIAFEAQQSMADAAGLMHRRKPMDFLIAATAHQHGFGVLHYDRDFDLIAEHGGLDFASVWIVPQGSLDG